MFAFLQVVLVASVCFASSALISQEKTAETSEAEASDLWRRYIRDFRSEHHFSLMVGYQKSNWELAEFNLPQKYDYMSDIYGLRLHYTYHIQLVESFGFYLGTGLGGGWESSENSNEFNPSYYYSLPSLKLGLVYNFSTYLRGIIGYEQYLKRYDQMRINIPGAAFEERAGLTMTNFDLEVSLDYFQGLKWGWRGSLRYSFVDHIALIREADDETSKSVFENVEASFRAKSLHFEIGLIRQIL